MKSISSRRPDAQANEIDEKADEVCIDVLAEMKKSTKKSTRCRRVHGRAKEVDRMVDCDASRFLSIDEQVDEIGQNFSNFLFRLGKGFFGNLILMGDSRSLLEDSTWI
ncbi:OLC1v1013292C1 [Oldenlandia corymbosa var. corymbosa]|uniref:OLC1v1013292C1 n=1 Tax=Oldenlandia corymbosa var. corymbosa TaxID=529605 RepID=A0AAV1E1C4_OLDCO|nr:OLC1v1013292C1 [Oldenlandia corymbosa var. corymbosa]